MKDPASVLVVGACAAGLATVQALRRRGFKGRVTLLGAEPHLPYDRPPLSKQVLSGAWEPQRAQLQPEAALTGLGVDLVLGDPAAALDVDTRTVHTVCGRDIQADAIVIATGASPRTLPRQPDLAGVYMVRTLEDTLALREALTGCSRLVVVGDGVLAAEIAATARSMGVPTVMTGPQAAPLENRFGPLVAGLLADLHTGHGVGLRLGVAVEGLVGRDGRVTGVRLDNGAVLPADVVVVAVGVAPATSWLAGSGLRLEDGVVCDSRCRAADGIFAAGDVARWHHEEAGGPIRLENRTNAAEQADAVAAALLGENRPYLPVPYFWTDQFDTRIQVHGTPSADADVCVVEGSVHERRFVALYHRGGLITAVLGWNMPKQVRLRRQHLTEPDQRVLVPASMKGA